MILFALIVVLVPFFLFANGDEENTQSIKKTLDVHTLMGEGEFKIWESAYEAANPNVDIKLRQTATDAYFTAIQVDLGSDNPPDVFFTWIGEWLTKYVRLGLVANLKEDFNSEWGRSFSSPSVKDVTYENGVFAVPIHFRVGYVFYNTDIFSELDLAIPKTWSDLKIISDKLNFAGYTPLVTGGATMWQVDHYIGFILQKVVENNILSKDYALQGEPQDLFSDPGYVEAFQVLKNMVDDKILPATVTSIPYETAQALFFSGKAAMFFGGDWNVGTFEGQDEFNYSAFRLPEMMDYPGSKGIVPGHHDAITISEKSSKKDLAIDFVKFVTSEEMQIRIANEFNTFPTVQTAFEKAALVDVQRTILADFAQSNGIGTWLNIAVDASLMEVLDNSAVAVLSGDKTPQEVVEDIRIVALRRQKEKD